MEELIRRLELWLITAMRQVIHLRDVDFIVAKGYMVVIHTKRSMTLQSVLVKIGTRQTKE
ncbi:unnamed protein product [Dovyalis caffra]|uniref:Uncharacterized protein n=1 Tax=Dovyalis caffra TaxID=77055 RepID=A0AAV1SBI9_9ROSI|nr:unnamed protein product [Dovyalis caffra]